MTRYACKDLVSVHGYPHSTTDLQETILPFLAAKLGNILVIAKFRNILPFDNYRVQSFILMV